MLYQSHTAFGWELEQSQPSCRVGRMNLGLSASVHVYVPDALKRVGFCVLKRGKHGFVC